MFASPSHRWSNPRARLLEGPEWDAVCEDVLAAPSLDMPLKEHLAELVRGLDAGWKQLVKRLEEAGPAAKLSSEVQDDGRVKLHVDKLGALGESKSLTWLRKRVEKMLPKIDLPDLAFGRSRGGLTTKIHLAADSRCRPLAFVITPGQAGDAPAFTQVMDRLRVPRRIGRPRITPDAVLADKA